MAGVMGPHPTSLWASIISFFQLFIFRFPQFGLHLQILPVPYLFLRKSVLLSLGQCILERSKNLFPHDSNVLSSPPRMAVRVSC
jgi:hypothetical protein